MPVSSFLLRWVLVCLILFNQFAGVQFLSFSLFMGIAMSITAFPVLASIVQEEKFIKRLAL
jgi:Kef-type K+ transport system membrane component KefB